MRIAVTCPHCGQNHIVNVDRETILAQEENERLFGGEGDGEIFVISGAVSRVTRVKSE